MVALAATATARGYWLTTAAGVVYTQGDAHSYGDARNLRLKAPIIAMAATSTGKGYWLLGADGGIFTYGDARFYGSTGAKKLNKPIVDFAPTPSGKGYWLIGGDGGVFTFGDTAFLRINGRDETGRAGCVDGTESQRRLLVDRERRRRVHVRPQLLRQPRLAGRAQDGHSFAGDAERQGLLGVDVRRAVYAFGDAPSKGSATMSPAVDIAVG